MDRSGKHFLHTIFTISESYNFLTWWWLSIVFLRSKETKKVSSVSKFVLNRCNRLPCLVLRTLISCRKTSLFLRYSGFPVWRILRTRLTVRKSVESMIDNTLRFNLHWCGRFVKITNEPHHSVQQQATRSIY